MKNRIGSRECKLVRTETLCCIEGFHMVPCLVARGLCTQNYNASLELTCLYRHYP